MARYELSLATGEKILVDHPGTDLTGIIADLESKPFIVLREVTAGSSLGTPRELIVASRHIAMIWPVGQGTRQGSDFRPKR